MLGAQATQTVPPDDPVYRFIDRLVAARLVDTVIVGQRAMSRREIGRIIAHARLRAADSGWLANRLVEYASSFPESSRDAVVSLVEAQAIGMDSPSRGIEPDGNGSISARVNPLASNRLGQPVANGQTYAYRVAIGSGITPWLAAGVDQRLTWMVPRSGASSHSERTDRIYARGLWKNASLLVGRDHLFLGQGRSVGLMGSLNPRTIDQVRIASDRPFVLPWLLKYAGPLHGTIALGDLGDEPYFPHTRFFTYKLSSRPHPRFEIGAGLAEQVGGRGAPGGTFLQKAGDAFPLLDAAFLHRNFQFSNKLVAVDIRYAIPKIPGAQFYAEGVFDDFDIRRVRSVFTEDAGYVWGLSTSCLRECGPVRATVEYHVTGLRYYTHTVFQGGLTVDDMIIGNPLGPRARGAYGSVDVDGGRLDFDVDLAYEDRSGNKYGSVSSTPDDANFHFVVLERHPAERRWRAMTTATMEGRSRRLRYSMTTGVERVENFGHAADAWRTNWLIQLGIQLRPTFPF